MSRSIRHYAALLAACSVSILIYCVSGSAGQRNDAREQRADERVASAIGVEVSELRDLKARKGLSNEQVLSMTPVVRDSAFQKLRSKRPGQPMDAELWRVKSLVNENGVIPQGAVVGAKAAMQQIMTESGSAGGFSSTNWTSLGPDNVGGRTRGLAIHPTVPNRLFAGSVSGGIWRSDDGGQSWARMGSDMSNLAVTDIVFLPGNAATMFASTGEGFGGARGVPGAGVWKSVDGGASWAQLPSTASGNFRWVNDLAMAPDGSSLLAATGSGVWRSANQGVSFSRVWAPAAASSGARSLDVEFHPSNAAHVVGNIRDYDSGIGSWFSTAVYSSNGGITWTQLSGSIRTNGYFDRIAFAWHAGYSGPGPGCVYAQKYIASNGSTRLYRSVNGGASYSLVSTNTITGNQGWYNNCLWVDPSDVNANVADDVLICGGVDLHRSADGGVTFNPISQWWQWPASAHADHHRIVSAPGFNGTTNRRVYFANDGGVWRADDIYAVSATSGWISLNNGYSVTQLYGAAANDTSGLMVGGSQDNGTMYSTGAASWGTTHGGDGGFCAIDPTNPNYCYGEYIYLQIGRSTDGGVTASPIYGPISGGNFIAPFLLDPNNAARMLAGGDVLWRTNDVRAATVSWTSIKPATGVPISAIAVTPGNPDRVYVGHNDGSLYRSDNATAGSPSWTLISSSGSPLPARLITRISIDPNNTNRICVSFGGYSPNNIWRTTNAGASWVAISSLPAAPVRDVEYHPTASNVMYAATEVGFIASVDDGLTWSSAGTPAFVAIDEMFWSGGDLYLATYGLGLFRQTPGALPTSASSASVGSSCVLGGVGPGPNLNVNTLPKIGASCLILANSAPVGGLATLFISAAPQAPTLLSPGCFAQVDLLGLASLGSKLVSAGGIAFWQVSIPNNNALMGQQWVVQAAVIQGASVSLTNGQLLTLGV